MPRLGRLPRLLLAGTCLLLALLSALGAKRAKSPHTRLVPVLVAARGLPAGHPLVAGDVRVARWPAGQRPVSARASPRDVIGRRLAAPIAAGEAVTGTRLVGRDLATGLGPGRVAVSVPLDEVHSIDLVHVGDRVDVFETPRTDNGFDPPTAVSRRVTEVADGVLVLAVLPGSDEAGAAIVVAADRSTAIRITRDRTGEVFTPLLDGP